MNFIGWIMFDVMEMAMRRHLRFQRGVIELETTNSRLIASALYTVLAMDIETARAWALAHDA